MTVKKLKLIFILFFINISAWSQTVLLNVDRKKEAVVSETGPNMKKFSHVFFRAGLIASPDERHGRIIYGSSANFSLGFRQKYKVSPLYSTGFDIQIDYTDYKLVQEQGKILPDTIVNNVSGRLDYSTLGVGFYNRINFDTHRGNFLGTFLDLGIMGEWHYSIDEIKKNKMPDGTKVKTISSNLKYTNDLDARVFLRLGFSHIAFYASYRITDLFRPSYKLPDLPKAIAGIEIAAF